MRSRSLVKWIRGMMAKNNCMLRMTWLDELISGFSPAKMVRAAGMMARERVIRQPGPHAEVEVTSA
jgi:hypothetical protein